MCSSAGNGLHTGGIKCQYSLIEGHCCVEVIQTLGRGGGGGKREEDEEEEEMEGDEEERGE